MASQSVQFRRGNSSSHSAFTGAEGELTVNTDKKVVIVHDGSTTGGHELVGTAVTQTLSNKEFVGVTTIGDVKISSGIVTASSSSGIVTYYGDFKNSRVTLSGTTGSLGVGDTANITITGYKSYLLQKVGISSAAWVVLYTDADSRTNDQDRTYLTDPTPGSGVIAEVRTTNIGVSTFLMSPGVIGWNDDITPSTNIYVRVTNNESSTAIIQVDLTAVKMES